LNSIAFVGNKVPRSDILKPKIDDSFYYGFGFNLFAKIIMHDTL